MPTGGLLPNGLTLTVQEHGYDRLVGRFGHASRAVIVLAAFIAGVLCGLLVDEPLRGG